MIYQHLIKRLLMSMDPESAHHLAMRFAKSPFVSSLTRAAMKRQTPLLKVSVLGKDYLNPIGLAAGFDKDCEAFPFFAALGFGFVELGSVTREPQSGNDRPRIFRDPAAEALINRMGFPSLGVDKVASRLHVAKIEKAGTLIGANIGKSKSASLDDATADYVYTFKKVVDSADYVAINISSPNTPDLRKLQEKARLSELLTELQKVNPKGVPLLVKVSPDLSKAELDEVVDVALSTGVAGLIATNTTLGREGITSHAEEVGGMSGRPLRKRSLDMLRYLHPLVQGRLILVGVGGISSVTDVIESLRAGASLVQIYTALIYQGPMLIARLKRELADYMERSGITTIDSMIGVPESI